MEFCVICALIVLVFCQWAYNGFVVNKLIDKLMSKSFYEYQQGKLLAKDEPPKIRIPDDPMEFEDLNSVMG